MRHILPIIALSIGLTSTATTADARATWGEKLAFVSETTVPDYQGSNMSLCHLVDYMDVLFVPVYTSAQAYVLSSDGCTGPSYRTVPTALFADMQARGVIPSHLPQTANLGVLPFLWGHAWLVATGLVVLLLGTSMLMTGKRRKKGAPDTLAIHSLVAMSQVAITDGRIDDTEVRQISSILTRLTGQSYSPSQVMDMLGKLNPSASDLAQVGQDLSEKDRQIVLEAALNIAVADGEIHPNEYAVVSELAQRMRIGADQFRSAMARISAHLKTMPAG